MQIYLFRLKQRKDGSSYINQNNRYPIQRNMNQRNMIRESTVSDQQLNGL